MGGVRALLRSYTRASRWPRRALPVDAAPAHFRPDLDALRAAVTGRTRLLSEHPHNPTGMVLTRAEIRGDRALAWSGPAVVTTSLRHLTSPEHIRWRRCRASASAL